MDKKQHSEGKAKSVAESVMGQMKDLAPASEKIPSSDGAGWKEGFGGEYGAEMAKRQKTNYKMKAKDANLHLFEHKSAGYTAVKLDAVRKSSLSEESKQVLSRYAHCAWEIRAEANPETGEAEQYFVLREDIELK